MKEKISVIKAREHNLKNISVDIPKRSLTVITGPSGSGKSTLALDVLFTEGKRRYMESLSSYARQFLGIAKKPAVEKIDGLCPAIAIEQKTVGANPRSTVGTITEIYDYMRVLFARIGKPHCPKCGEPIKAETPERISELLLANKLGNLVTIKASLANEKKGEFVNLLKGYFNNGYRRYVIDGTVYKFKELSELDNLGLQKNIRHNIEVIIDAITIGPDEQIRLQEAIEQAFKLSGGSVIVEDTERLVFSAERSCLKCSYAVEEIEPRLFSFNSPIGACKQCHGLGFISYEYIRQDQENDWDKVEKYLGASRVCHSCKGKRLNEKALAVTIGGKSIIELADLSIKHGQEFLQTLKLEAMEKEVAHDLLQELINRYSFLKNVGLEYLTLNRTARTLSGGEGQRIRLATQIGSSLRGVVYILDEPSIGLHQRDNDRLINTLKTLRDQGNTVVVVEHDTDTMLNADYIIDMGPGAGVHGGTIVAAGTAQELAKNPASLTGAYLSGAKNINLPTKLRKPKILMRLANARANNLKHITVDFPLGVLCGVSGVSGSGKSSLIFQELVPALKERLERRYDAGTLRYELTNVDTLENMVVIDQSPIGRTPRSNAATYLGIFDDVRALFANLPESKIRGYQVGQFSFNVRTGRCAECAGEGTITVQMHFLPDVIVTCKQCKGKRYNKQTLDIMYRQKTIADVLQMTTFEAAEFFAHHAPLKKRLDLMCQVGLDYLTLGQPATTLSGGEAQRLKLVKELAKRGSNTIYILDEPTTGLHVNDIAKLLTVFNKLVDKGNSIIVIEHNLDVLKTVDYLIDLGPEGGQDGGLVVAAGTPEQVAQVTASHTGKYLKQFFKV
jgi:excinuclease ABC subunit A